MNKRLIIEGVWLVTTLVVMALILYPIYRFEQGFEFYIFNIASIFVLITFTRYIFLLHHSFLFRNKWMKGILFFLCIPIFFFILEGVFRFRVFMDDFGVNTLYAHLDFQLQKNMGMYTRNEMIFFGIGALISSIILPFRLIIATWRDINNKNI